jgi:hypothetical protein
MISPLVSKVKLSILLNPLPIATVSEMEAAPPARLKALLNSLGDEHHRKLRDVSDSKSSITAAIGATNAF